MIFSETNLKGAFIIKIEKIKDERGFFARTLEKKQFREHKLDNRLLQCNISFNKQKGTIRGMHYQIKPFEETKLVSCTHGKIFDVIIDLRPKSKTYRSWFGIELTADNYTMIYVPKGFAHGFQTLINNTEVFYQMSDNYNPKSARGIRWNDKIIRIKWPLKPSKVSKKDLSYELLK